MYYLQDEFDKIDRMVEPQIVATDIPPEMLAFYALSKLNDGDTARALDIFEKAKQLGVSKKSLERVIRNPKKTVEFISRLSSLGDIN